MRFYYSPGSPYVKKALMVAVEAGLARNLSCETVLTLDENPGLRAANPLHRIPTLVLDDGTALYDSPVICAWFAEHGARTDLYPNDARHMENRVVEALADGMMDATRGNRMERLRPEGARDQMTLDKNVAAIRAGLERLETTHMAFLQTDKAMGHLAACAALDYLDFRASDLGWRNTAPRLAAWYEATLAWESQRATMIQDPAKGPGTFLQWQQGAG